MKITSMESLHADGGGRAFDYLKISTDEGIVGWSEYNESFGGLEARPRTGGDERGGQCTPLTAA
jgi:galactonate dehydratase